MAVSDALRLLRLRPAFYLKRVLVFIVAIGLFYCVRQLGETAWSVNHQFEDRQISQPISIAEKKQQPNKHHKNSNNDLIKGKEPKPVISPDAKNIDIKGQTTGQIDADKNAQTRNNKQINIQQKSSPVILTTTNSVFLDFTKNWLESIRKLKTRPKNITIVTEDIVTYEALAEYPEVYRIKPNDMLPPNKTLTFNTPEYKAFVNKRPRYILELLEQKIDVLFSDVDTVWLGDLFTYFTGNYDMFIQIDQSKPKLVLCAGFSYYRSTENMINFVKEWIIRLDTNQNKKPDQIVLNIMLRERRKLGKKAYFKYKALDKNKFVSGQHYFDDDWRKNNSDVSPVFLHNNWIVGHDAKVERFKKLGYWYI